MILRYATWRIGVETTTVSSWRDVFGVDVDVDVVARIVLQLETVKRCH